MEKSNQDQLTAKVAKGPLAESAFDGNGGRSATSPSFQLTATGAGHQKTASAAPLQMKRENAFMQNPQDFLATNVVHEDIKIGMKHFYGRLRVVQPGKIARFFGATTQMEQERISNDDLNQNVMKAIYQYLEAGVREYALAEIQAADDNGENGVYALTPILTGEQAEAFGIPGGANLVRKLAHEAPIPAHFIPFGLNVDELQSVVINPEAVVEEVRFAFTPGMNGCAMQVDQTPDGKMEATHFPNVGSHQAEADERRAGDANRLWHGYDDYHDENNFAGVNPPIALGDYPSANVMLHNTGEGWTSISQEKVYNEGTGRSQITRVNAMDVI